MKITAATEHAHAADRFAREIIAILTAFVVRLRRLMGRPLGGSISLGVCIGAGLLRSNTTIHSHASAPCPNERGTIAVSKQDVGRTLHDQASVDDREH